MVGPLDQGQVDVIACGMIEQAQCGGGGNFGIIGPLQEAGREGQRQRGAQHQMLAAILDQAAGDAVAIGGE